MFESSKNYNCSETSATIFQEVSILYNIVPLINKIQHTLRARTRFKCHSESLPPCSGTQANGRGREAILAFHSHCWGVSNIAKELKRTRDAVQ